MKRKLSVFFAAFTLLFPSLPSDVIAKDNNGKESLVAIGDSIPFGYNLENNNHHVSKQAFPALIGEEAGLRVRNLGMPGWTTDNLLHALQNDQKFRQAVAHADYVTISVGSNDLLRSFSANQTFLMGLASGQIPATTEEIQSALGIPSLLGNLNEIIATVNELSDAKIVVYNIYNPFVLADLRYQVGAAYLPAINGAIAQTAINSENVTVADAFSVFNGDIHLIEGDIHPNASGHEVLAGVGYLAID